MKHLNSNLIFFMKSRLIFFEFPVGVKSICIDGKKKKNIHALNLKKQKTRTQKG